MTVLNRPEKLMTAILKSGKGVNLPKSLTEAESEISWLLFFNREDGDVYKGIGDYYYSQKKINLEKTAFYYEKAFEYNPQPYIDDFKKLVEVYDKLGEKKKKEDLIYFLTEMLIKRGSKNRNASELAYFLADEKLKEKDYGKALDFLDRSLKTAHEPWVFCNLQPLPLLELDKETMARFAEKLFPLNKDYLGCFYQYYAKVFYLSGFREKAVETNPNAVLFWLGSGDFYLKNQEFEKAKELFEACLKYSPDKKTDCQKGLQMAIDKNSSGFNKDFEKLIKGTPDF